MCNCNFVSIPFFFTIFRMRYPSRFPLMIALGNVWFFPDIYFFTKFPFFILFIDVLCNQWPRFWQIDSAGLFQFRCYLRRQQLSKSFPQFFPSQNPRKIPLQKIYVKAKRKTTKNFPFSWGKTFLLSLFSSIFKNKIKIKKEKFFGKIKIMENHVMSENFIFYVLRRTLSFLRFR